MVSLGWIPETLFFLLPAYEAPENNPPPKRELNLIKSFLRMGFGCCFTSRLYLIYSRFSWGDDAVK